MSRKPVPAARPTPKSFGQLLGAVLHWIGSNFWRSITSAIFAGIVGYVANVLLMLLYYDGYVKTGSGPATGQGNLINGSLIWAFGSTTFFALWGYRRAVGGKRFWSELRGLPNVAQELLKADGPRAYVHLLWGAALALVTMQLVSPWLGGIMAIGVLGMLPSFLTRVLVGFGQSVWSWVASKFAPKSAEPPGAVSMVVGLIGSMIALAAGFFLPGGFMSLMMSVVFGAGAYMLSRRDRPPGGTAALLLVCAGSALLVVLDLFMPGLALAHDGGLPENQGSIVIWWNSDGSRWLLLHATAGGAAAGIGAPTGLAIGDMWARQPLDQSIIDDILRQPNVMVDPNWSKFGKSDRGPWTGPEAPPAEQPPEDEPPAEEPRQEEPSPEEPLPEEPPADEPAPAGPQPPPEPPPPPPPPPPRDGDVNPNTGEVWSDEDRGWVGRSLYEWEKKIRRENAASWERNRNTPSEYDLATRKLAQDIAEQQAQIKAQKAADDAQRAAIAARLSAVYKSEGRSTDDINDLAASGDTNALKDLYGDHLRDMMKTDSAEAAAQTRWANTMDYGSKAASLTLAAAKTGMMVVAGPAGYVYATAGMGVIRAAEEGANTYVASGGNITKTVGATGVGLLCGIKDGAVGRFTNLPGTGIATKILVPAAADAGETFVRTRGDVGATAGTFALSGVAGAVGTRLGGVKSAVVRESGQALLGGVTGAAGSVMSGGDAGEGFVNGVINSVGGSLGGHTAQSGARNATERRNVGDVALTPDEAQLNKQATSNAARGKALVDDYVNAPPDQKAVAAKAILENRDAKMLMKGGTVDDSTKSSFAADTNKHRTQPLFQEAANHLNTYTTADGQQRFVVREPDPQNPLKFVERPVTPADFRTGSGATGGAPGMDLDFSASRKVFDKSTGQPGVPGKEITAASDAACNKLGFNATKQEINAMHESHPEALPLKPGETPKEFFARSGDLTGEEGKAVTSVTDYKIAHAKATLGTSNPAGAVAEQTRGAVKDFGRVTQNLMGTHPNEMCQRRSKNASAGRSKSASRLMA